MKERDVVEAIIDMGMERGKVTYDEINDALPSEFFSLDELAGLVGLLIDMGVKVIEYNTCPGTRKMRLAVAG
ncbi:MAG: RNA polymerase sigma factor region1.1 domain-containing protein [Candidatus Sulfobium sp.]|jgi:RNA polymerase primary sigma factor